MVSRKTQRSKTVKYPLVLIIAILSFTFTISLLRFLATMRHEVENITTEVKQDIGEQIVEEGSQKLTPINFQPIVDQWVASTGGRKGVVIYDPEVGEIVGYYNADQKFDTASLYKLFVVYEGYRQVQNGALKLDENAGRTGYTILKCLDLAIRESYSPCAETLWTMIGRDTLDKVVRNDFNIPGMTVSDLEATPTEIMQIMKLFYSHPDIKDQVLLDKIQDSFLNQPTTEYNWRQGLPSGFSEKVDVYNKVGWDWNSKSWDIYNDAAILNFRDEGRQFIVVVMTSGVRYQQIRDLGVQIEKAFYDQNVLKN